MRAGLARLAADARTETMQAMVVEDDPSERLRLFDEFVAWMELMRDAHVVLNEHLRALTMH